MSNFPLVDQFFSRDLTEAEDQSLEELIASSREAAAYFEGKAQAAYQSFGMPEPSWPVPSGSLRTRLFSKWFWILLCAVLLSGGTWAWVRHHKIFSLMGLETQLPAAATNPPVTENLEGKITKSSTASTLKSHPGQKKNLVSAKGPLMAQTQPAPASTLNGERKVLAQSPSSVPANPVSPQTQPMIQASQTSNYQANGSSVNSVTPIPIFTPGATGTAGSLGHPGLRVVVERGSSGLVTVDILNEGGDEVRMLYAGMLRAGRWAFEWDGRLQNGSKVSAGVYFIQVKSGSSVQKEKLLIDR